VPTHEDGRLIFWEFATDYYDLGFGLYFEWTISPSSNVTVHVSDSSEEEEGEEGIQFYLLIIILIKIEVY
jgi:golgi resident protein GCP60